MNLHTNHTLTLSLRNKPNSDLKNLAKLSVCHPYRQDFIIIGGRTQNSSVTQNHILYSAAMQQYVTPINMSKFKTLLNALAKPDTHAKI
jgi:hypothetical protein